VSSVRKKGMEGLNCAMTTSNNETTVLTVSIPEREEDTYVSMNAANSFVRNVMDDTGVVSTEFTNLVVENVELGLSSVKNSIVGRATVLIVKGVRCVSMTSGNHAVRSVVVLNCVRSTRILNRDAVHAVLTGVSYTMSAKTAVSTVEEAKFARDTSRRCAVHWGMPNIRDTA
jgi:hypothetical protein